MIAVEEHEKDAHGWREEQEPVLKEHIGVEESAATPLVSDQVLALLVVAIEGRKVDVRRSLIDLPLRVRRAETRMDNERRKGEHER